jgi:hypothetical protein
MTAVATTHPHAPRGRFASRGAARRRRSANLLGLLLGAWWSAHATAQVPPGGAAGAPPSPAAAAPADVTAGASCTADNLVSTALVTGTGLTGSSRVIQDGVLAQEGTIWNAPQAVQVRNPGGELLIDLREERELRFFALQGDNNDYYGIEGSLDRVSYTPLWTADPVTIGMGLRTRSVALPKSQHARYLRVRGSGGDGYFSVSELRAHCKQPKLWPPKLIEPPVDYGWSGIENERMVKIKGWAAALGTLLLLALLPRPKRLVLALAQRVVLDAIVLLSAASAFVVWRYPGEFPSLIPDYFILVSAGIALAVLAFRLWTARPPKWLEIPPLRFVGEIPRIVLDVIVVCSALTALVAFLNPYEYFHHIPLYLVKVSTTTFCVSFALRLFTSLPLVESLLGLMGMFAFLSWWNLGHFHFDHYEHTWEHYHYYVGAKYGPELRYSRLYICTAAADMEDGLRTRVKKREMRDLARTNELGPSDEIVANPMLCTSHFSPERWRAFRDDIRFFRNRFSTDRWDESQTDHGYNGTPVWAIAGRLIADFGELTWRKIQVMAWIDSVFLLGMWIVVLWAFGWRATCVALLWWGFNFPARFYWNGGSFLRYDWILWMVVGICLLKKRYHFSGGMALTYATLLRVFPGFVVAALILKALARIVRTRRLVVSRSHMRFAAGCLVALALLMPASGWATGGLDAWGEFAKNSHKHLSTALTNNMGLKTALGYDADTSAKYLRNASLHDPFSTWKDAREYYYKKRAPILYALILLFCVVLARAGDREPDWAAACLGAGLIAMAAELTCYYYGFLLTYGLLWSRHKIPGVLATALAGLTCLLYGMIEWNDDHFAGMSLATSVVIVAATALIAFGPRASAPAEPE